MKVIGFMVICLAMMTADSESPVVPTLLMAIGAILVLIDTRKGENNE